MGGGTEAFPDLGEHCSHEYCKQLDFLPFICDGCKKVFCMEHRTYKGHDCPNAEHKSRMVVVCEACSVSIEKASVNEEDELILELHKKSGDCDVTKKQKPRCPVKRCKEILTFSNNCTCKICNIKVCLKHRFPADHNCKSKQAENSGAMVLFQRRSGTECGVKSRVASPSATKVLSRWFKGPNAFMELQP